MGRSLGLKAIGSSVRPSSLQVRQPLLDGIDDIPWADLTHAYGCASDVPEQLRSLASHERVVRDDAIDALLGNIWHQGTVYEATPYALPFLILALADPGYPNREGIAVLVASILAGQGYYEVHADFVTKPEGALDETLAQERRVVADVRRIGLGALQLLTPFLCHPEAEVRSTVAEALGCYPSKAEILLPLLREALSLEQDEDFRERIKGSVDRISASSTRDVDLGRDLP